MKTLLSAIVGGALLSAVMLGCNTTPVQDGAVVGGALGAGLGAIVGNQSGRAGEGALIGAGAGALTGALVGDSLEKAEQRGAARGRYEAQPRHQQPQAQHGHYENRIVHRPNGETYEERVWVPHR